MSSITFLARARQHLAVGASLFALIAVESGIGQRLSRTHPGPLFHFLYQGHQRRHIASVKRDPLRHDQMILTDRDLRRVAQRETAPLAQEPRLAIAARQLALATLAQPL
jgi:hypothetical protein